jgi:hypothetical protein
MDNHTTMNTKGNHHDRSAAGFHADRDDHGHYDHGHYRRVGRHHGPAASQKKKIVAVEGEKNG